MLSKLNYLQLRILKKIRTFLLNIQIRIILPLGIYDKTFLNTPLDDEWKERIKEAIDCPDNKFITRQINAGECKNGTQTMHNGIKITLGGYYGAGIVQMLDKNKGVHEPQEEYAFNLVLKTMPDNATMIELGSYWSFYSIWFYQNVKNANNFMIEPDEFNLLYGVNNFRLNKAFGKFTKGFIGKSSNLKKSILSIDYFCKTNKIDFIDVLHSDIQGSEYEMLLGAAETIRDRRIGYIFISTHSNKIHYQCITFLELNDFKILCHADENETYSYDGLIVAKSIFYSGLESIQISKNKGSLIKKKF